MGLKSGLKRGKDDKDSSKGFLKEPRGSASPAGTVDNCEKHRGSAADPDYCRRILVRGETRRLPAAPATNAHSKD